MFHIYMYIIDMYIYIYNIFISTYHRINVILIIYTFLFFLVQITPQKVGKESKSDYLDSF